MTDEPAGSQPDGLPAFAATDPRFSAVWAAVPDPVRPELPGEGAARRARIVAAFEHEVARRQRFGALAPLPLRWAAACAPVVGLVLGLVVTTRLTPAEQPFGRVALAEVASAEPAQSSAAVSTEPAVTIAAAPPAAGPEPAPEDSSVLNMPGEPGGDGIEVASVASAASLAELYLEDLGLTEGLTEDLESYDAESSDEGLLR